jgi:hypothetical protein
MYQGCVNINELHDVHISFVHLKMVLPHLFGDFFLVSLQGIMDLLGNVEELLIALDDLPSRFNAKLIENRHHPVQYLCHTSPFFRRIDMEKRLPSQFVAKPLKENQIPFR